MYNKLIMFVLLTLVLLSCKTFEKNIVAISIGDKEKNVLKIFDSNKITYYKWIEVVGDWPEQEGYIMMIKDKENKFGVMVDIDLNPNFKLNKKLQNNIYHELEVVKMFIIDDLPIFEATNIGDRVNIKRHKINTFNIVNNKIIVSRKVNN